MRYGANGVEDPPTPELTPAAATPEEESVTEPRAAISLAVGRAVVASCTLD